MGKQLIVPELDRYAARDRIKALLMEKIPNRQIFAEESSKITGLSKDAINNVLGSAKSETQAKTQEPSMEFMAICAQALDVTMDYIMYGKESTDLFRKNEFIEVPFIESSMDGSDFVYSKNKPMCLLRLDILRNLSKKPENIVMYKIDSDVMESTFFRGDEVMIDRFDQFIYDGGIYAYTSFNFQCIRVRRFSIEVDCLKLIPDNRARYDICIANRKDINIIGKIILSKHFL